MLSDGMKFTNKIFINVKDIIAIEWKDRKKKCCIFFFKTNNGMHITKKNNILRIYNNVNRQKNAV